ncbi:monooxygenase [Lacticaseibacillus chiayiensis]|uniref:Monooxygenase n=1 Tax=Lacticaseibacillus chiayiensis TaxID=2100821 RepID=A0A4Q1UCC6_9LACO|nr:monooxygenase [Lacticaseibacillus chiayiensis]QVI33710.1 monooxygenase [Lacticaseibacillus chiayiensis]RXT29644.1 monooxygenase [Lacticaseibacillus chiayiensis]RXT59322.1 monooxygenase [Lacticaseibacillus chiayiensis]UYN55455.1 monooxygenase [Lacticaseibacillus chiayiensis]
MSTIQTVFGSKSFLVKLLDERHDPQLKLLKPAQTGLDYMIYDPSGRATFSAPLRYDVIMSLGSAEQNGYVQFMYFNLDTNDVKVFLSKIKQLIDNHDILLGEKHILLAQEVKHPDNYLVVSVWQSGNDYYEFKNTPALSSVKEFIRRAASANGFHEAGYTIIDAHQKD